MRAPSFKGLYARCEAGATKFTDGHTVSELLGPGREFPTIDDYVRAKILTPRVHLIEGAVIGHQVVQRAGRGDFQGGALHWF